MPIDPHKFDVNATIWSMESCMIGGTWQGRLIHGCECYALAAWADKRLAYGDQIVYDDVWEDKYFLMVTDKGNMFRMRPMSFSDSCGDKPCTGRLFNPAHA